MDGAGGAEQFETVIIGGGQLGLSVGYHLARRGRRFVILDANQRIGDPWRKRWDSLRLFTPPRYDGLPGWPFPAPAWSFPTKDEVADYLEAYAARFDLPVRTGVRVDRLSREGDRYVVAAGKNRLEADHVVVAAGAYQRPSIPHLRPRARPGHPPAALQPVSGSIPAAGRRRPGRRRRQLRGRDRPGGVPNTSDLAVGQAPWSGTHPPRRLVGSAAHTGGLVHGHPRADR